jgi:hypothetical protein
MKSRWWEDGTKNIQVVKLLKEGEKLGDETAVLLIDYNCDTYKRFEITEAFKAIAEGRAQQIELGSTCEKCGKHIGVILIRKKIEKSAP